MIGHEKYSYRRVAAKASASLLAVAALFVVAVVNATAQTPVTPPYVVSSQIFLGNNQGGAGANYAANSRGDFFILDGNQPQHMLEYPANGGAPITLFTTPSGNGPSGVAVDPFDNVFLTQDNGPGGNNDMDTQIYEFPSTNQTYPGPYVYNSGNPPGSCNIAIPAQPPTNSNPGGTPAILANTGVCAVGSFVGPAAYYWQPRGIAADGQGDIYFYSNYDNTYNSISKGIFACDPLCVQQGVGGKGTQLTPIAPATGSIANAITSIATNYAGDVYFVANYPKDSNGYEVDFAPVANDIYVLPASGRAAVGSTHQIPILFDSSLNGPYGVQFDRSGNLYVSDANGIWEYPAIEASGAPCQGGTDVCTLVPASKFQLIPLGGIAAFNGCNYTAANVLSSIGIDNKGNFIYSYGCLYYGRANLYETSLWSGTFPATEIGSTASAPLSFTVMFDQATTIKSITAVQGSTAAAEFAITPGTCAAGTAYAAGSSCTFTVSFTPGGLGLRAGAIQIADTTGKITTTNLSGVGNGTAVTVDPGTPSLVSSTFKQSTGLAVDGTGNVYVADTLANTVTEIPAGGGTAISVGTGLSAPTGVAVDGSGNVFIVNQGTGNTATTGTGTVVEVPNVAGVLTNSAQATLLTGLNTPTDIVIDNVGDLYISVTGSNEVLQFSSLNLLGQGTASVSRGYGLSGPTGLALDNSGNIFVADTGNGRVLKIADGSQADVGNGLSAPTGVAIDASGSVIIADGSGRIIRVPNEGGQGGVGLNQADQQVLDSPLSYPYSVRLDGAGNIYVSDNVANQVYQLSRTAGTIDFGNWNVSTVSDPQTIVLSNAGTDLVTIGTPVFGPVPASTGFTVAAGTSSQACGGGNFNSGFACQLTATFAPTTGGESTYALSFTAPNVVNPVPAITLKGDGVSLGAATISIMQTAPVGAIAYGDNIAFSAVVAPTSSTAPTPTGSVVFSFDGQDFRKDMIAGPPQNTPGVAYFTFPPLTNAGTHTLSAHYLGDSNYPELQSAVSTVVIAQASSTNMLAVVGDSADPLSAAPSSTVNMTDTVCPANAGLLQGTVTFYNLATNPATALDVVTLGAPNPNVLCSNGLASYTASFAFNATNGLRDGNYVIDAVYSGNTNYTPSTSASYQLTIIAPTFTVTLDKTAVTSTASAPGTINLIVNDYSNFLAGVSFTCTPGTASGATSAAATTANNFITNEFAQNAFCVVRPVSANLAPAGSIIPNTIYPVPIAIQFQVDQSPLVVEGSFGWAGAGLAVLLLFILRRRIPVRGLRLLSLLFVVLCLGGIASLSGCGSGGSGSGYKTPAGTYNVVITATATPEINGVGSTCNLQNCNLPPGPTNLPVDIVQTYNATVTVK